MNKNWLVVFVLGVILIVPAWAQEAPVIDEAVKAAVRDSIVSTAEEMEQQAAYAQKEKDLLDQAVKNLDGLENSTFSMENTVCPVTGKTFGPDFSYVEVEWEGGIYRVCSEGCKETFLSDPAKYSGIVEKEVGDFF